MIRIRAGARLHAAQLVYITLEAYPPKDLSLQSLKAVPYAKVDLDFKWDKGTDDEVQVPTLEWIGVPKKFRNHGLGFELVKKLLIYMKTHTIKLIAFDNYERGFWFNVAQRLPRNVILKGRIGFLCIGKPSLPWSDL